MKEKTKEKIKLCAGFFVGWVCTFAAISHFFGAPIASAIAIAVVGVVGFAVMILSLFGILTGV